MSSLPTYPKPDYRSFCKNTAGMAVSLVVLHWAPDVAVWIHAAFYGEDLVIEPSSYRTVLFVAYIMSGLAFSIGLAGLLWSAWHHRRNAR